MKSVILDAMEIENHIEGTLKELLIKKNESFSYFKLKNMNILPCRSCASCCYKTPGKCVFQDDMPEILKAVANSDIIVLVTPIRFGGYSSQLKKAIDKLCLIGMPLYIVKNSHMLHPMRYGNKSLLGIGMADGDIHGQVENFQQLVGSNALNMQLNHKTLVFKKNDTLHKLETQLQNIYQEVFQ